jgi:hypothetical protein
MHADGASFYVSYEGEEWDAAVDISAMGDKVWEFAAEQQPVAVAAAVYETQKVTATLGGDITKGQIRIPKAVVKALGMTSGSFTWQFSDQPVFDAKFNDGISDSRPTGRSGTIYLGKKNMSALLSARHVVEGERLSIARGPSSSIFKLDRLGPGAAAAIFCPVFSPVAECPSQTEASGSVQLDTVSESQSFADADAGAPDQSVQSWFHVNPLICSKRQQNWGFGPYLHHSLVSIAMDHIFDEMGPRRDRGQDSLEKVFSRDCEGDYERFRVNLTNRFAEEIADPGHPVSKAGCQQVAMFMTQLKEDDIIVMRHVHRKCPFLPSKLKTLAGGGYKPVYALVRVTRRPTHDMVGPTRRLGGTPLDESIVEQPWAEVEPMGMGFIDELDEGTRGYLAVIKQSTIKQLKHTGHGGKFSAEHRADFLAKAKLKIIPAEFPGFTGRENGSNGRHWHLSAPTLLLYFVTSMFLQSPYNI